MCISITFFSFYFLPLFGSHIILWVCIVSVSLFCWTLHHRFLLLLLFLKLSVVCCCYIFIILIHLKTHIKLIFCLKCPPIQESSINSTRIFIKIVKRCKQRAAYVWCGCVCCVTVLHIANEFLLSFLFRFPNAKTQLDCPTHILFYLYERFPLTRSIICGQIAKIRSFWLFFFAHVSLRLLLILKIYSIAKSLLPYRNITLESLYLTFYEILKKSWKLSKKKKQKKTIQTKKHYWIIEKKICSTPRAFKTFNFIPCI